MGKLLVIVGAAIIAFAIGVVLAQIAYYAGPKEALKTGALAGGIALVCGVAALPITAAIT